MFSYNENIMRTNDLTPDLTDGQRKAGTTTLVPCVELISNLHALLHDALRFKSAKARVKKIIHETRSMGDEYKD